MSRQRSTEDSQDPPAPPEMERRIRLYPSQWVGLALLTILPALAIAGVFGETWKTAHVTSATLDVNATYPDRFRYKQLNQIELWVRNASDTPMDTVKVSLDTGFAVMFSTVQAIPPFLESFSLDLTNLQPGETRLVIIELQGERYGRHAGMLRIVATDTIAIPLSIRIFP